MPLLLEIISMEFIQTKSRAVYMGDGVLRGGGGGGWAAQMIRYNFYLFFNRN